MKQNITERVADVLRPVTSNTAALLHILCEPELDHWSVANSVFCMKPKAINPFVVLRLAERILVLPVTGLITRVYSWNTYAARLFITTIHSFE